METSQVINVDFSRAGDFVLIGTESDAVWLNETTLPNHLKRFDLQELQHIAHNLGESGCSGGILTSLGLTRRQRILEAFTAYCNGRFGEGKVTIIDSVKEAREAKL